MEQVPGVSYTARNPKQPPSVEQLPCINLFEGNDVVLSKNFRGKNTVIYKRRLEVVLETFVAGSTEPASSKELFAFVELLKAQIYQGGNNLNKKASLIDDVEYSRVHRPPIGDNVAGVGIAFEIIYIEEV
jgi:hypothetical protein